MDLKQTYRVLMLNFVFMVTVTLLLVVLYECEILMPGDLEDDKLLVFYLQILMEMVTIVAIPLALKLFSIKAVHRKLVQGKGAALLPWGTARLNMLCLPMLINTYIYYLTMSPAFGYMAIILFLCLFFIYPSEGRCIAETEDDEVRNS